ncbi:MAG: hypothetical protein KJN76_03160 [Eudoraea sp.]|nr:hypothetical protein [Eudoraea sp.]
MENQNIPIMNRKQLWQSVVIAILIGGVVLVTAVLPAEYNIDPLGAGKLLGFSRLYVEDPAESDDELTLPAVSSKIKPLRIEKLGSAPEVARPREANNPPPTAQYPLQTDTIEVLVPARKGIEYKFNALKHASVKYDWSSDNNSIVYIDFHGEVKQEDPPKNIFYESYALAYSNNMAGTFTAPFEGKHGWYFRNDTQDNITITIHLNGQYQLMEK